MIRLLVFLGALLFIRPVWAQTQLETYIYGQSAAGTLVSGMRVPAAPNSSQGSLVYIPATTWGQLGAANSWTGNNTFSGELVIPRTTLTVSGGSFSPAGNDGCNYQLTLSATGQKLNFPTTLPASPNTQVCSFRITQGSGGPYQLAPQGNYYFVNGNAAMPGGVGDSVVFNCLGTSSRLDCFAPQGPLALASGPLALGAAAHNVSTSGTTLSVSLTTVAPTGELVLIAQVNLASGTITSGSCSVSSTALGSWGTPRAFVLSGANNQGFYEFAIPFSAALTSENITIACPTVTQLTLDGLEVEYANASSPFDQHTGLPVTGTAAPLSISTTGMNDFILGAFRMQSPAVGSGWTQISSADFQLVEYQIVSSAQSSLPVPIGASGGAVNGAVSDAYVHP